jgi:hypothetical protein
MRPLFSFPSERDHAEIEIDLIPRRGEAFGISKYDHP